MLFLENTRFGMCAFWEELVLVRGAYLRHSHSYDISNESATTEIMSLAKIGLLNLNYLDINSSLGRIVDGQQARRQFR